MDELIARLEKAAGPDRDMDFAIERALPPSSRNTPYFTASIDAALTLVPNLWGWKISRAETQIWSPDGGPLSATTVIRATHPVPAMALCSAALKARAELCSNGQALPGGGG